MVLVTFMWFLFATTLSWHFDYEGMGSLRRFRILAVRPGIRTVEHFLQVLRLAEGSLSYQVSSRLEEIPS